MISRAKRFYYGPEKGELPPQGKEGWGTKLEADREDCDRVKRAALGLLWRLGATAGDAGKIPDPERIPYAPEQLCLSATTIEPTSCNY